jgi:glycosyltransferase involved in cell wall biosynthesis
MRELVRLGVEVHVAVPPDGPLFRQYQEAGVIVYPVVLDFPVQRPQRWRNILGDMQTLVRHIQPDMIHSHFVGTTLTMRLALGKADPTLRIFQVPGPLHLEHCFFRQAELLIAGKSDYWIASCEWTCDRYRRSGIPRDHVFLSYYGTDIENLASREPGKLRSELGIDADTKLVGMVAFMYAPKYYLGHTRGLKGHEDLIDALELCFRVSPNIMGVFIGGAWNNATSYENQVRAYGKKRCGDRVVFLGTRNDVLELYPDLDVVVHPSHSENVGGAAESLLLAVPTIATNVGGFPDLVKPGETGWLAPAGNPARLAECILAALRDPARARQMAAKGQALARNLFDVRKTARQVFEIYQSICAQRSVG